jgi:hypothetical protein
VGAIERCNDPFRDLDPLQAIRFSKIIWDSEVKPRTIFNCTMKAEIKLVGPELSEAMLAHREEEKDQAEVEEEKEEMEDGLKEIQTDGSSQFEDEPSIHLET